jgi:hypothetical protein
MAAQYITYQTRNLHNFINRLLSSKTEDMEQMDKLSGLMKCLADRLFRSELALAVKDPAPGAKGSFLLEITIKRAGGKDRLFVWKFYAIWPA